jgi:hypothetical protein
MEVMELQFVEVIPARQFGIGSQEDLESSIENETVDDIGAHATADAIGCLENADSDTR